MGKYIQAGYRLCIETNLKEVTTYGDDGSIDIRPKSISMDRICHDAESMKSAIDAYMELEKVER
jgi:hypothetical protein